jgi:hypothetical protein
MEAEMTTPGQAPASVAEAVERSHFALRRAGGCRDGLDETFTHYKTEATRALLGWEPTHESLLEDLRFGDYITGPLSQP